MPTNLRSGFAAIVMPRAGRKCATAERRTKLPQMVRACPPGAALVPLTRGLVAVVDASDYHWITKFTWHAWRSENGTYYAHRCVQKKINGKWKCQVTAMHRQIVGVSPRVKVDHRNRDTLDNRRSNLREASHAQNMANRKQQASASGYKGVRHDQRVREGCNAFYATISAEGRRIYLGSFPTAEAAARARDAAALKLHGDFAALNFPLSMAPPAAT